MTKLLTALMFTLATVSSGQVLAAETNNADMIPPAQVQKNQVPDSTSNGDYLETQPDENGATSNTTNRQTTDKKNSKQMKSKSKDSNATNLEKSKRMTESPENGGTTVNP